MKTKAELNALKEEVKTLNAKLAELSDDELALVTGGTLPKDFYENVILNGANVQLSQVDQRGNNADKNAKIIYS